MKKPFLLSLKSFLVPGLLFAGLLLSGGLSAQNLPRRIASEISGTARSALPGSTAPFAQPRFEAGRMAANEPLGSISMVFKRTAEQESALQELITAQGNPNSPQYHKWLSPEEFGARFGMSDEDLAAVQQWLQQQGFAVVDGSRSRNSIRFSGTVGQVEQAFSTEMHYYQAGGERRFAPSTALSLPAAITPTVAGMRNLSTSRPRSMKVTNPTPRALPSYTYQGSLAEEVLFAPGDLKIAYGMDSLANTGNIGTGQTIAVLGQSAVNTDDMARFQTAAGLTQKTPTLTLVPGTGTSTTCSGDEGESDLDLEWAGAAAPGATLNFVYTGVTSGKTCTTTSYGVYDSLQYAIQNKIGNILSLSYGTCETFLSASDYTWMETLGAQAATQGQTIVVSSGDDGSTACYAWYGDSSLTDAQYKALVASFPATSAYVTAIGGTEITDANNVVGTYWSGSGGSVSLTTAKGHIPEVAWNDDSATRATTYGAQYARSAGGGGVSAGVARPSWQTGVTGIPATSTYANRLVPDVSLYSSGSNPGYLYCSSDSSSWSSSQTGSCISSKFYDSKGYFTIAGGTSFAAPIFAGMVAVLNQAKSYTTGSGLINPTLYQMAANSTTYASAFYDITAGGPSGVTGMGNECAAGTYCSTAGASAYATTTGYDMATGLGSVNLPNLVSAWSGLASTTTTVTPSATSVTTGTSVTFTIAVTSTTTPSGTVNLTLDGTSAGSCTLTSGSCTYASSFSTAGAHTLAAAYAGDSTHSTSSGSGSVTVTSASASATTTTVTPSATTTTTGTTVNFAVAVAGGSTTPTGQVQIRVDGSTIASYTLTSSAYTYATSFSTTGSHTVAAYYLGDTTHAISNGSATVTVNSASTSCSGSTCFTLSVSPGSSTSSPLTISQGSTVTSTVTVTSQNSYAGTVAFSMATNTTADYNAWSGKGCYKIDNKAVTANGTATQTLTIYTSSTACSAAGASQSNPTVRQFTPSGSRQMGTTSRNSLLPVGGLTLAGVLLFGLRRRKAWLAALGCLLLVGALSAAIGCGSKSTTTTTTTSSYVAKGTYTLTLTGADATNSAITNTASVVVTVN